MSIIGALAQPTTVASRVRRASAPGSFHLEDEVAFNAPVVVSASASVGLHGLLGLQEAEANEVQDRAARRYAGSMLAELSAVQGALLKGDAAGMAMALAHLSGLARDSAVAGDARLAGVVRAIAMRAAVETARHAA